MGPFETQVESFTLHEGTPILVGADLREIDSFVIGWRKRNGFVVNHRTMVRGIKNAGKMETSLWDIYREKWKRERGISGRPRGQDAEDLMDYLDAVSRAAGASALRVEDNPVGSEQTSRRPIGGM